VPTNGSHFLPLYIENSSKSPSARAQRKSTFLAKGENPDVAGLHNENDFNMLTPLLIRPGGWPGYLLSGREAQEVTINQ
jgi:hypothetical protein